MIPRDSGSRLIQQEFEELASKGVKESFVWSRVWPSRSGLNRYLRGEELWERDTLMDAKSGAREWIEAATPQLLELSHRIHANPELGFEEERACAWLCE